MYIVYRIIEGRKDIIQHGLTEAGAERTANYLRGKGYEVYTQDITEV